jgi:hypothetical protein
MLSFIKKFFGAKPTVNPCSDVPYKVETPAAKVTEFPFPSTPAKEAKPKAEKKTADKKPAAKAKPARKPKTPK